MQYKFGKFFHKLEPVNKLFMNYILGKLVCIIVENESDIAAFKDFKDDSPAKPAAAAAPPPSAPAPPPPVAAPPTPPPAAAPPAAAEAAGGRVYVSPMAKRLAEQRNIRLQGMFNFIFVTLQSMYKAK